MVSLVIVSHSRKVATAVAELVKALTSESLPIAIAGGVGEDYAELGTDATDIMDAIESVHTDDGTLVLVDMGSAILSTELALDFLGEDVAERVKITAAPVVEGAVAAAVQMGLNAPLETVYNEAVAGLQAKQSHLGEVDSTAPAPASGIENLSQHQDTLSQQFVIQNTHGLHARPVTRLIHAISPFNCQIGVQNVSKQSKIVDARSAISLGCLHLTKGDSMAVFALGEDAELVLKAVEQIHRNHFGESLESSDNFSEPRQATGAENTANDVNGDEMDEEAPKTISLSEGYALAPAINCTERPIHIEKTSTDDVSAECTKLRHAIIAAVANLHQRAKIARQVEAEILSAQAVMLKDPALLEKAVEIIGNEQCVAEYAWNKTIQSVSEQYQQIEDSYLQQRAYDVIDIGKQVLMTLGAVTDERIELNEPAILFFSELSPSQATELDPQWVKGVVTERGGSSSHAAIIVRSLGIPAISGFGGNRQEVRDGDFCIIDGYEGRVYCRPDADLRAHYEKTYHEWKTKREQLQQLAQRPAETQNGVKIDVFANIASLKEAQALAASGADGVGLLRTEFLFLDNADAPSEEIQYEHLREILQVVNKPVTIRTFDIGGDKQVPYVNQQEQNPFLGVRGVRLYRQQPELFDAHIRAILRASLGHEVKVMFPMIATLEDFNDSKQRVEAIHQKLTEQGIAHQWPLPIGMMVETPAAVLLANELAELADFFSIGTNDLTQYVMAADRGAVALANYANPLSVPVLRMLKTVIEAAEHAQIPVSLCGNPGPLHEALPKLIGLGLRAISLSQSSVPEAKQIIAEITV